MLCPGQDSCLLSDKNVCVYGFVSVRYSIVTVGTNHKNMSSNASISQISYQYQINDEPTFQPSRKEQILRNMNIFTVDNNASLNEPILESEITIKYSL